MWFLQRVKYTIFPLYRQQIPPKKKIKQLEEFGITLKDGINLLTSEIYNLAGEEFNINSTKQLGTILFEKLKLPALKKTKSGYSTDVDVLEKLKNKCE